MRNLITIAGIILFSSNIYCQLDTSMILTIQKIDTAKPIYNYYQVDSIFDYTKGTGLTTELYCEKSECPRFKIGQTYEVTVNRFNPTKFIVDGDTLNFERDCYVAFGKVWREPCSDSDKVLNTNCLPTIITFFEIVKINKTLANNK